MKNLILVLLFVSLSACGDLDEDGNEPSQIVPQPLSLEGFAPGAELRADGCRYQVSFIDWFVKHHAQDLERIDGTCSNAKLDAEAFPDEYKELDGHCKADACSVYVFSLTNGETSQQFMGLLLKRAGHDMGVIVPLQPHGFRVYLSRSPIEANSFASNSIRAPSRNLPLLSLTFNESLIQSAL